MPYSLKIFLFFLFLSFIYSEIQFNSCENNKRKIIFENGIIKEFSCNIRHIMKKMNFIIAQNVNQAHQITAKI